MTAESIPDRRIFSGSKIGKINLLPEYPACDGHPGSSPTNWVPTDYVGYLIAKALHVTDEDIKKRKPH